MSTLEYGKPAEWAAQQKWKRRGVALKSYGTAAILALVCLSVAAIAALMNDISPTVRVIVAVIVVAVGSVFAYKQAAAGKHAWTRAEHARVGVNSERQVQAVVRKFKPVAAVFGAKLGPRQGDCDLVLVDKSLAIGAVEIKTGSGKVAVYGDSVRVGRKTLGGNPLGQTLKTCKRLDESLNVDSLPVLCIPGMTNRPFVSEQGIVVCSAKELVKAVGQYGNKAFSTRQEAQDACTTLWNRHLSFS